MLRTHLRATLPATVAALCLGGCMPNSSGPSIPSIPRSSVDVPPIRGQVESIVPTAPVKKPASRRPRMTQAAPKARLPEQE